MTQGSLHPSLLDWEAQRSSLKKAFLLGHKPSQGGRDCSAEKVKESPPPCLSTWILMPLGYMSIYALAPTSVFSMREGQNEAPWMSLLVLPSCLLGSYKIFAVQILDHLVTLNYWNQQVIFSLLFLQKRLWNFASVAHLQAVPGWPQFPVASQITVSFNLRFANPDKLILTPFACRSPSLCFLAHLTHFFNPYIWAQEDEVVLEVSCFLVWAGMNLPNQTCNKCQKPFYTVAS